MNRVQPCKQSAGMETNESNCLYFSKNNLKYQSLETTRLGEVFFLSRSVTSDRRLECTVKDVGMDKLVSTRERTLTDLLKSDFFQRNKF